MTGVDEIGRAGREVIKSFSRLSAFLNLLADEISDLLMCEASDTGYFLWLSNNWEQYLGWTNAELQAKPWLEFVHPDDREATIQAANTMKKERVIGFTNRYRRKDGAWIKLRWKAEKFNGVAWCVARPILEPQG